MEIPMWIVCLIGVPLGLLLTLAIIFFTAIGFMAFRALMSQQ